MVPGHDEAAIRGGGERRLVLAAGGRGVDAEFAAYRAAIGGIALAVYPVAATVLAVGFPHHDETPVGQRRDLGCGLVIGRGGVDQEFAANRVVVGVVALAEDAPRVADILVVRLPDDDVAAIVEHRNCRFGLLVGGRGVDYLFLAEGYCAVNLGNDIDLHRARDRCAAVAIADTNGDRARGDRIGHRIGVGQVLDDALDRIRGRVRIEQHGQLVAVLAIADDRADFRAFEADAVPADAHLRGAVTLVANTELILVAQTLQAELVLRTVAGQIGDFEDATVEIRRIGIEQADARVDQLRDGVDRVFAEGHAGDHIHQLWIGATDEIGRIAKHALEHAVGVGIRMGVGVVVPHHDEGAVVQCGDRGLGGVIDVTSIGSEFAVDPASVGVVLLGVDAAAIGPCDGKAAIGQRSDAGLVLVGDVGGIDPELVADRVACGVVALGEDAV